MLVSDYYQWLKALGYLTRTWSCKADRGSLRMKLLFPFPSVLVVDVDFESRLWGSFDCFVSETFLFGNADLIVWCFGPYRI